MAVKKFVVVVLTMKRCCFPQLKKSVQQAIRSMMSTPHAHSRPGQGVRAKGDEPAYGGIHLWITGTTTALSGIGWIFNADWP